jgi:peptidoglycan LD-endopeptidase LytH
MKQFPLFFLTLCSALLTGGCAVGEQLAGLPRPTPATPRDAHAASVGGETSAARAWQRASQDALRSGLSAPASFRERIRFPHAAPYAVAYRFEMLRGQTLHVRIDALEGDEPLFADVFEMITARMFRHVHAAADDAGGVTYTATWDGTHVLRLQPRLEHGGLYEVTILGGAPLAFPVEGADISAVGSVFGDPRDGGARGHEGVDIFAPRGTPVLAVADARVTAVQHTRAGGRVIWLADAARNISYYYAHLDEQHVRQGQYVSAGDPIGTVGNSGNAGGTRPHLHFGVYRPGTVAIDPAPLLAHGAPMLDAPLHDATLGSWVRVSGNRVRLRSAPSLAGGIVAELRAGTPLLVLGAMADWRRVLLEDGTAGFIAAQYTSGAQDGAWQ